MGELLIGAVLWFPQDWSHEFYILKGVVALAATVLLIFHMSRTWSTIATWAQRLRYFALLYLAALMTFASVEQTHQSAVVNYRNLGGMVGSALILVAAVVSIWTEARQKRA